MRKEHDDFRLKIRKIRVEEYQSLRKTTSWDLIEDNIVKTALENDLFSICVYDNEKLIGMGRVIGDGAIYFYIQDIIVTPEYKGRGVGKLIMSKIELFLNETSNNNSFVGLMAVAGVKEFYYKFGYKERPDNRPGMYKIIKH
ncbi:MAG: GNAT family N-acetyltransferase [Bacteroidetes bacterium]|nr:GNAT family N-acetyltransferase [Bacteroidota bacterium]